VKVAIVHYWLINMRGGEKVLEALCELFPEADIYTHVYNPALISDKINQHCITTTFIQRLPFATKAYQKYLLLMPLALEQLDLTDYDLVISSESGPAKGVITSPDAIHLCYCHTPMRYLWDMYPAYQKELGWLMKRVFSLAAHYLRLWDCASAARVDYFLANSNYVRQRIKKFYRREAQVIHPPIDVQAFRCSAQPREDYYLVVSELVSYKRVDLAVEACNQLHQRLVVIGSGEQHKKMAALAGDSVTLLGRQPFAVIKDHYASCRALIFPGQEDFGMVPVEAMASGAPVIAFRKGGATETVKDGVTGVFFDQPTVASLLDAIQQFEKKASEFSESEIVAHAEQFDIAKFKKKFLAVVEKCLASSV